METIDIDSRCTYGAVNDAEPTCEKSSAVGNAAKCKELLREVYDLLDKSKSYIKDVESINRKRQISHYLTRAKNLVDNIINADTIVGDAAKMREACTNIAEYTKAAKCHTTDAHILGYLDQIESWAKAALAAPPEPIGNSAKMREAISKCVNLITEFGNAEIVKTPLDVIIDIEAILKAALAEHKCEAKWRLGAEYEFAYCSHCGHQQWASWDTSKKAAENIGEFHKKYKFCPNCGFGMKGVNNE